MPTRSLTAVSPRPLRRLQRSLGLALGLAWVAAAINPLSLGGCAAQEKGTIGAVLAKSDEGRVFLREVPPDLAAGQAGLQVGDEVLLIDGIDVRQLEAKAIHELLSGDVQQPIDLTLVRDDEVIRVTLQRTQSRRHRTDPAPGPETP